MLKTTNHTAKSKYILPANRVLSTPELVIHIFSFLPIESLLNSRDVCQQWRAILNFPTECAKYLKKEIRKHHESIEYIVQLQKESFDIIQENKQLQRESYRLKEEFQQRVAVLEDEIDELKGNLNNTKYSKNSFTQTIFN
ncbi:3599_t:CDS:1 [Ambispora gerdemannii]|uniref:3599_t:CDS:1 n=1 Tax=Ambispora gerdemannii TaxID=144530 RepID=A0A9N9H159_9GLOM|nr:3599_t:CDS:1 [Ambispora gerdemannii]